MPTAGDFVPPPEWSNWKMGDWGKYGPEGTQTHWHGVNCQVYEDGSLGPRPGWKQLSLFTLDPGFVIGAIAWRKPGPNEPNDMDVGIGRLHIDMFNPTTQKRQFWLVDADPLTIDFVPPLVSAEVDLVDRNEWDELEEPGWWEYNPGGADVPEVHLSHVASLGGGATVTIDGRVYDHLFADAQGTLNTGDVAEIKELSDPDDLMSAQLLSYPTMAVPYGIRMFYTGVEGAKATDIWYSQPNNFSNIQADVAEPSDTLQNRFSTSVVDVAESGVTCLQEVPNGLLVGTLPGRLHVLHGKTPETGTFRVISEVGAPSRPWAYALVGGSIFFIPPDGRGVVSADSDGADTSSYGHLRVQRRADHYSRRVVPHRAIGSPYNQFVCLGARNEDGDGFSTLEHHNGVWVVGEEVQTSRIDYCSLPGGRLARVLEGGGDVRLQVRDECLNTPWPTTSDWSNNLEDDDTPGQDKYAVAILPELRLIGVPKLTIEGLVIEVDYWKGGFSSPELYLEIRMLREGNESTGPISYVDQIDWTTQLASINHMPSDLGGALGLRYHVNVKESLAKLDKVFAREYPAGYGMQIALRFRNLTIHRVIPRLNTLQWKQYVDNTLALGETTRWGRSRS